MTTYTATITTTPLPTSNVPLPATLTFRSLADADLAYTAHADALSLLPFGATNPRCVAHWAGMFSAAWRLDDCGCCRVTQRTSEIAVTESRFADYCASLATYLLEHPEYVDVVAEHFPTLDGYMDTSAIEFTASLRPDIDGKPLWYSVRTKRVTAKPDRRFVHADWKLVPAWADGSLSATVQLLDVGTFYDGLLDWYARVEHIRKVVAKCGRGGFGEQTTAGCVGLNGDSAGIAAAFEALWLLVVARRARVEAGKRLEGYVASMTAKAEQEAGEVFVDEAEKAGIIVNHEDGGTGIGAAETVLRGVQTPNNFPG